MREKIILWSFTGILITDVAILGWIGYIISKYLPQILHAVQTLSGAGS